MRTTSIDDIISLLPPGDREAALEVIESGGSMEDMCRPLASILAGSRDILEKNGMVPEYVAYAIPFLLLNHKRKGTQ